MQPAPSSEPASLPRPDRLPFTPPFFYGWVIVACAIASAFAGSGTLNVVLSVLLKPIEQDTGWSRTMITTSVSLGALGSGLLAPIAGSLADRYGGRILMPAAGAICGTLYFLVANATTFPMFVIGHAANRAISSAMMGGVVAQATVTSWFIRRRPRALGMVGLAAGLGASTMAIVAQFSLYQIGWRGVLVLYGLLTFAVGVAPSLILVRRRPEDVGLMPDGESAESLEARNSSAAGGKSRGRTEYPWTLREAVRTRAFWLVIGGGSLAQFGVTAISTNQIAYFTDRGLPLEVAAGVLAVYTFSSGIASLVWGFLTEHFEERAISVVGFLLASLCVWFLTTVDSAPAAFLFVALFGLCVRGQYTLVTIVFAQYYGRANFGAIFGLAAMIQTFATAIGPVAAAYVYDTTGSYLGMFNALIGIFAFAACLMFLARRPVPPSPAPTDTLL